MNGKSNLHSYTMADFQMQVISIFSPEGFGAQAAIKRGVLVAFVHLVPSQR